MIAGILEACNASGRLEYALECAATNKGELEKVLEHYKDEPEKYKAACFLIENMPYHYALEGEELDSLKTVLASADAYGVMLKDTAVPDWDYYTPSGLQRKPDVLNIRAEFLINNIDLAFDGWKSVRGMLPFLLQISVNGCFPIVSEMRLRTTGGRYTMTVIPFAGRGLYGYRCSGGD